MCAGKGREGGIDRSLNLVVDVQSIVVEACKEREREGKEKEEGVGNSVLWWQRFRVAKGGYRRVEAAGGGREEGARNELLLPREPCRAGTSNTGFSRASKQDLSVLTGHEEYRFQYSIQFPSKRFSIPSPLSFTRVPFDAAKLISALIFLPIMLG